ncbi:MAG: dual specificity protein phosphatase family protein [Candidatus Omnitrophota bacterium]|nr:MAG: dual specificity protein phosphatase family protein [Candidatus Omnitrophota bacterium]
MSPKPEDIRDMEHMHVKISYNKISDLLYAGNNMCCQTHFEEELLSKGITADISLEAERLDNPQGVKYFFWFPWKEDTAPALELIDLALKVLDQVLDERVKVYVHCKNGHGRTTTFLSSYFIRKNKMSADEALRLVFEKRPSAHLNEIQKAFLIDYEKRCKK